MRALLERVGTSYGFDVIDYGEDREGEGLLIAVGSGLLMATMDSVPTLRYALDIGGQIDTTNLANVLIWADRYATFVAVSAWWSISDPAPIASALRGIDETKLYVRSNIHLTRGRHFDTIGDMANAIRIASHG